MEKKVGDDIVVSENIEVVITKPDGTTVNTLHPSNAASGAIVEESTSQAGIPLEPEYKEVITDTISRTRSLRLNVGFTLEGGFKFEVEYPPKKETRTTEKTIYKKK